MAYHYTMKDLGAGSAKFGPCEVCGQKCDTTYYQSETRDFTSAVTKVSGQTHHGCHHIYGHRECLLAQRKE